MDRVHRIALSNLVEGLYTNLMFYCPFGLHHALGISVTVTHHFQVVLVQTLDGFHCHFLRLVRIVIVFLSQRGTAMTHTHHKLRRLEGVEAEVDAKGRGIEALAIQFVHQFQQFFTTLQLAHLLQVGHDRLVTHLVATNAIHVKAIERTNLLSVTTLWQARLGCIFHDECIDALLVELFQVSKCAVLCMLLVQWVSLQPATNSILPEVITRFYTRVHIGLQSLCCGSQAYDGEHHS